MSEVISNLERDFEKILTTLREDLAKIRTGRANPVVVEDLLVEAYGERLKLKELAAIRAPGPRELLIEPWDKSILGEIERALFQADLGTSPVVEETVVRITFPSLTGERREALALDVGRRAETAKNQVRHARQEARGRAEELEKIEGEDFVFRLKKEIDEEVERVGEEIENIKQRKEQEIKG